MSNSELRLSVCQLSLPDTTFEEDLELIKKAGADGVAVAELKLRDGEDEQQVAALKASGLAATICIPTNIAPLPMRPAVIYPGPEDVDERVSLMGQSIERLAAFNPDCIAVVTGSAEGYSARDARRLALEGLREAARVATANNTRLALETNRNFGVDFSFLKTLPETVEFLDELGDPSVGILYDFYHLWDTDDIVEDTVRFGDRIIGVQYNDWREPPRSMADRVLPGDGVIDIPRILGALERGGFHGWYDLEVFSDDGRWGTELPDSLWKLPYDELLDRAHTGLRNAWEARS